MTRRLALPTLALAPALAAVLAATTPTTARAQAVTFPPDADYIPLRCGLIVMNDLLGDRSGFVEDRDLVGDVGAPAGLRASDADNLYLRIRVDRDPAPGAVVRPSAWGMAFDLDGNRATYELLVTVDGVASSTGTVAVYTNKATTLANDPADPADLPAAATFTFANTARTVDAGTTIGGNADFYVDLAIPWTTLAPLGLDRDSPVYVWAGSSNVANALDGDIACHDGRGGAVRLDGSSSDGTTGDPTRDPNNGGGGRDEGGGVDAGVGGTGELRLEGGSGCQAPGSLGLGAALALVGLLRRRRR